MRLLGVLYCLAGWPGNEATGGIILAHVFAVQ